MCLGGCRISERYERGDICSHRRVGGRENYTRFVVTAWS
jgi:hypothetical protein